VHRHPRLLLSLAPAFLLAAACGSGTSSGRPTTLARDRPEVEIPRDVTDQSYPRHAARLADLPDDDAARPALRDRLVQFLAGSCTSALERSDASAAADDFAEALSLYRTPDLPVSVDPRLLRCAEGVRRTLAPAGDEARVMAALTVLEILHPTDAAVTEELQRLRQWGEDARQSLPSEAERIGSLVSVYEELVDMLPMPEFVTKLQALYIERNQSLRRMFATGQMPPPGSITREQYQNFVLALDRTAYDVTRLHLRLGTPQRAIGALSAVRASGETDRRVQAALTTLQDDPEEGYMALAQIFGREHPEAALRACRAGRQARPESPRFSLCIARLLVRTADLSGALETYDQAIRQNPGEPDLYAEALEITTEALRSLLDEEDLSGARQVHRRVRRLLRQYRRAFPDRRQPVDASRIDALMGIGEYHAGNIDRAVQRLEQSVEVTPTKEALVQLGVIAERRSQLDDAIRLYRRALDLDLRGEEARLSGYWRATVLEHLGDVHATKNEASRARQLWEESLEVWRLALAARSAGLTGDEVATANLRRGMVLEKLGRAEDAVQAFRAAIDARPDLRGTYEKLLSHYAADGRLREALQIYRRAVNHASIPESWKVYYALWVVATQRRTGDSSEPAPLQYLQEVRGEDWTDRLAQFYAGTLPYERLLEAARTPGERAEAYFYEALNRLATGHADQGTELLRQVLATEMMGFFEYDMARRILAGSAHPPAAVTPAPGP
jgi:tetratricopeptide (TPR) repeat protein